MKALNKILFLNILIVTCVAFFACDKEEEKNPFPTNTCYDFVTFEARNDNGTTYTLQKSGDSPLITYTSSYTLKDHKDLEAGRRIIILYTRTDGEPYTSGPINLYGYMLTNNTTQTLTDFNPMEKSDLVKMTALTRTGQYINMQLELSTHSIQKPKKLELCLDKTTSDTPIPELHLVYQASEPGENYASGYASFDVQTIWEKPSCTGIKIIYDTPDGTFSKEFHKH